MNAKTPSRRVSTPVGAPSLPTSTVSRPLGPRPLPFCSLVPLPFSLPLYPTPGSPTSVGTNQLSSHGSFPIEQNKQLTAHPPSENRHFPSGNCHFQLEILSLLSLVSSPNSLPFETRQNCTPEYKQLSGPTLVNKGVINPKRHQKAPFSAQKRPVSPQISPFSAPFQPLFSRILLLVKPTFAQSFSGSFCPPSTPLSAAPSTRVRAVIHLRQLRCRQLRIPLRRRQPLMSKQLLNRPQVRALFQQMCSKRMPQRMRMHIR